MFKDFVAVVLIVFLLVGFSGCLDPNGDTFFISDADVNGEDVNLANLFIEYDLNVLGDLNAESVEAGVFYGGAFYGDGSNLTGVSGADSNCASGECSLVVYDGNSVWRLGLDADFNSLYLDTDTNIADTNVWTEGYSLSSQNQLINWTQAGAGVIDRSNYVDLDSNYVTEGYSFADYYLRTDANAVFWKQVDLNKLFDQNVQVGASPVFDNANMTGNISVWSNDSGFLSSVDISDNTNLTAGGSLTLTDDTLSVDDDFLKNTGDTGTGNYAFNGDLNVFKNSTPIVTIENEYGYIGTGDEFGRIQFYGNDYSSGGVGTTGYIASEAENAGVWSGLAFGTRVNGDATEQMRINYNGDVGIGTADPNYKLDIKGPWNTAPIVARVKAFNSNVGTENPVSELRLEGYYDESYAGIKAIQELDFSNDLGLGFFTSWGSGVNEKMRITHLGDVGIGTTNPETKLHIQNGNANGASQNPDYDVLSVENDRSANINILTPNTSKGQIFFSDDSRGAGYISYDHSDDSLSLTSNAVVKSNGDFSIEGGSGTYKSSDGSSGITDTSSYWLCTSSDCSTSCQVQIKDGLITGCT